MFTEIEHVEIITPDLEDSIKLYTEIIGFEIINRKKIGIRGISEVAHLSLNNSRLRAHNTIQQLIKKTLLNVPL